MKLSKLTIAGGAAALMLSAAPAAFAAGTSAGTLIENTVSLSYKSGNQTVDDVTASVDFKVDRKVDFVVENQEGGTVSVDLGDSAYDDGAEMLFRINNTSNDDVAYAFDIDAPSGFSHAPNGGVGTYRLMIGGSAYTPGDPVNVDEDGNLDIVLIAEFAAGSDGEEFDFTLNATPQASESAATHIADLDTVSTVWVFDQGSDDSDSATYSVAAPSVSASKAVEVVSIEDSFACNDLNASGSGGGAIPGACIEYTITVTNNGSAAARDIEIVDTLPGNITYAGSAGSFFTISESGGVVTASANTPLTNGASEELRIRATIN